MIDQHKTESRSPRHSSALSLNGPTYYELLDVSIQASRLQIRESYIRLRSTYASSSQALYSLVSEEEARQTLEAIEEAYRVLDDELSRKEYDESLGIFREPLRSFLGEQVTQSESSARLVSRSQVEDEADTKAFPSPRLRNSQQETWDQESQESRRPRSQALANAMSKIRRFAVRAFEKDVKVQEETLLARPETFDGATLTQLRELMGVPQSEIQESTKIAIEYIKALENNDFHKLPSLVYVRGFLKIYLQYLGIQDGKDLIEAYAERYNTWREKHRPHS